MFVSKSRYDALSSENTRLKAEIVSLNQTVTNADELILELQNEKMRLISRLMNLTHSY
ncbi:hypothetical protein [Psychrosphaera algicola]|uniref:hypothetical protein n=1 Tax=Psychrosphaera algicola TaxID=3023714 RepID=UPI002FEDF6A1